MKQLHPLAPQKLYPFFDMQRTPAGTLRWLFDPQFGLRSRLIPRWLFLRALALIYFSAFFSLLFQVRGLIGPGGILPADQFLSAVHRSLGVHRFWYAPTLYWINSSDAAIMAICWIGLIASIAALVNAWPRLSFFVCFVCFLSFVTAASDFSGYQSDGMLLEAGFLALFLSPAGFWPGFGTNSPPMRASYFLLQWEWFRIYFESGLAKLLSGDPEWRHFTAMDQYYQNCPLPTWIGYYVQQLPHWFHAATAGATLVMELGIVFLLFLPRRWRLICFFIVTPWEIGVILTANYTFLNYLVLVLGFLLLDDGYLRHIIPARFSLWKKSAPQPEAPPEPEPEESAAPLSIFNSAPPQPRHPKLSQWEAIRFALATILLALVAYVTTAELILMPFPSAPLPTSPISALAPFRIANRYGLFAVMTRGLYQIEFQGSEDGQHWTAYPFRYKPQALDQAPGIYAPYQPRFDWNLWFASLGDWQQNDLVPLTEQKLLAGSPSVLHLFAGNPFPNMPPRYVRAVLWQYWFTSLDEKRKTGDWWTRKLLGLYAPVLTLRPDGRVGVIEWPQPLPPHS
ncbi:MAG TPA: lipase maturation factor family protein [Acidobacteriaceae bacterium]|nr:lipase maturation factor family protein [Acidobacteriaceae bacterium]